MTLHEICQLYDNLVRLPVAVASNTLKNRYCDCPFENNCLLDSGAKLLAVELEKSKSNNCVLREPHKPFGQEQQKGIKFAA